MTRFTIGEISRIREYRASGHLPFATVCDIFRHHTREEMVEAYDAIVRFDSNAGATSRVNAVLALQNEGAPLVNGRPAAVVEKRRPLPMF